MKFANDIAELVYQDYRGIEAKDYQEKIRFFEHNRQDIDKLPYEVRLEMSLEYTVSLFEVGEYQQYLQYVDRLLRIAIEDNLFSIDGDDIYQELLFRKGCALHNLVDFAGADHIFSELIKIDPDNKIYTQVYFKNKVSQLRYEGQKARSFIIILLMLTGVIVGAELLVIIPFFDSLTQVTAVLRNGLFFTALLAIFAQEIIMRHTAHKNIRQLKNN